VRRPDSPVNPDKNFTFPALSHPVFISTLAKPAKGKGTSLTRSVVDGAPVAPRYAPRSGL